MTFTCTCTFWITGWSGWWHLCGLYTPELFYKEMQKGKRVLMDSCMELSKFILGLKYIWVKSSKVVDVWAKTCFPLVLLREGNKCEREHDVAGWLGSLTSDQVATPLTIKQCRREGYIQSLWSPLSLSCPENCFGSMGNRTKRCIKCWFSQYTLDTPNPFPCSLIYDWLKNKNNQENILHLSVANKQQ